ncbi:MAG TPA: ABC transporter ATP-binding protein [Candidatus Limnocylindrales bacterium]|nr:ABC transporter ATP-binding protein [Candidatus Limnocylindrales bacterium]
MGLPPPLSDHVAIDVRDLGVSYSLRFTRKTTLHRSFTNLLKRANGPTNFWALQGVGFHVVNGESLAVIGPNGAGKSTLLQVLAGIILPTTGTVDVRGRVSSLLTLGAGFDQELTGRENIHLAGAFMGIDHRVMEERLQDIVDFADIGDFIDAPIRTYSTGMRARLGFSIATAVDPDILLLDEVLATGDQVFRAKSRARVMQLVRGAKAVILVAHDMNWVIEFCNRAILLEHGRIVAEGEPEAVVAVHRAHSELVKAAREAEIRRVSGGPQASAPSSSA